MEHVTYSSTMLSLVSLWYLTFFFLNMNLHFDILNYGYPSKICLGPWGQLETIRYHTVCNVMYERVRSILFNYFWSFMGGDRKT